MGVMNLGAADFDTDEHYRQYQRTRNALKALGVVGAVIAAPVAYSLALHAKSKKNARKGLSEAEIATGGTLEQVSAAATNLSITALAAPAIAVPLAYWLIEIGENWPPHGRSERGYWYCYSDSWRSPEMNTKDRGSPPKHGYWVPEQGYWEPTGEGTVTGHGLGFSQGALRWVQTAPSYYTEEIATWVPTGQLEGGLYSGEFGDKLQTLIAASMAAPALGGLFNMAASAFRRVPKG